MTTLITLSLALNIAVLLPVSFGLITNANWASESYGARSPARGILLAIYLAILLGSAALLLITDPKLVLTLLAMQVVYKVLTPITVGTLKNPVVISNLAIAVFHAVTITAILRNVSL